MKRASPKKAAAPATPSGPKSLGEVLRASLSYVAGGGGGGGLTLNAAECRDVLGAIEHARQSAPITASRLCDDFEGLLRQKVEPVPKCEGCATSTAMNRAPTACREHVAQTVDEAVRLRQQMRDVLSLVSTLTDAFGERRAIPGQMLMGLAVQLQAIRDNGGAP
ncbi:hypothetical protein D7X74_21795 [Corallococcus sp. CA047B]|uniref:hypothetical protein n=1 Tax=Corallococcus sp. CA047B TaxID=2316729 RepID=UPI000EA3CC0F|nr:hypothetical protein [Corallococcus sp. CA047B]RKH13500.1 hypothetical protein D7X74_21795 [Corallococcus sp. CA047B]